MGELVINRTKRLNNDQFYPQAIKKTQIFWHHTAGMNAAGAIAWWNQTPDHVGTAYVIDRDGTIYEVFDPKSWAYHLGIPAKNGGDGMDDKDSIGIEIVSAGWVNAEVDGTFTFYPLFPNKAGAQKVKAEEVWDFGEDETKWWRGHRYYHAYSEKQIDSLLNLTKKLAADFGILIQDDLSEFYEYNKDVITKHTPGLWSHSTVLMEKSDIIPHNDFMSKVLKFFLNQKTSKQPRTDKTENITEKGE